MIYKEFSDATRDESIPFKSVGRFDVYFRKVSFADSKAAWILACNPRAYSMVNALLKRSSLKSSFSIA